MKYNQLGSSNLNVSNICLGSMTWGTQNTESEGHEQIDYALERGVNFIDTAEMYPATPISAETQGRTEEIIGSWIKSRGKRDQIILATKVTGEGLSWVQDGIPISREKIRKSLEGSLKRLDTDYVDLYQLHWPNRGSYHFRQNWRFDPTNQNKSDIQEDILETLQTLDELIKGGLIREVGLSNESCWGTMQFLRASEMHNLPKMISVQNEYSLMYRSHDLDLAEMSHNESVSLLPFSPLACGLLTGKYQNGKIPDGSRLTINPDMHGRVNPRSLAAIDAYVKIADDFEIDPTHLALAYCHQRPFIASSIIGATSIEQLDACIQSSEIDLSKEIQDAIHEVHHQHPMPY
ncbi:MAG: aryl-alcohol dehydrogenase-like predicted oxidoreductase [Gammaproteobacteria bacterium]|jgi:aryl-alcohol dehydrogenase-like predicted oxidoreductase